MNATQKRQVDMHKGFFDRCTLAIDNKFYLEAIFLEYAAIESRLEAILGMLGAPCNKKLAPTMRQKINISNRIECLKKAEKAGFFAGTKMPDAFFVSLSKWIGTRNRYIHGLYKNDSEYSARMKEAKKISEEGMDYCRILYNEAKRLNRLLKKDPEFFSELTACLHACYN